MARPPFRLSPPAVPVVPRPPPCPPSALPERLTDRSPPSPSPLIWPNAAAFGLHAPCQASSAAPSEAAPACQARRRAWGCSASRAAVRFLAPTRRCSLVSSARRSCVASSPCVPPALRRPSAHRPSAHRASRALRSTWPSEIIQEGSEGIASSLREWSPGLAGCPLVQPTLRSRSRAGVFACVRVVPPQPLGSLVQPPHLRPPGPQPAAQVDLTVDVGPTTPRPTGGAVVSSVEWRLLAQQWATWSRASPPCIRAASLGPVNRASCCAQPSVKLAPSFALKVTQSGRFAFKHSAAARRLELAHSYTRTPT